MDNKTKNVIYTGSSESLVSGMDRYVVPFFIQKLQVSTPLKVPTQNVTGL
jgi:hypothetical protein